MAHFIKAKLPVRLVQQMTSRVPLYLQSLLNFTHKLNVDEFRKPKLVSRYRNKLYCESNNDVREDLDKARKQAIPKLATWEAEQPPIPANKIPQITFSSSSNVVALSVACLNLPVQVIFGLDIHAMVKFQNLPTYPLPCEGVRVSSVRRFPGVCEWV